MELTTADIVKTEVRDDVHIVEFLSSKIREETEVHRVLQELGSFIDDNARAKLLINMANLEYLSSAGLGNLVGLLKKSRKSYGEFKLCCLQESIQEPFEVMRLDKIFDIFPTLDEAVSSF